LSGIVAIDDRWCNGLGRRARRFRPCIRSNGIPDSAKNSELRLWRWNFIF